MVVAEMHGDPVICIIEARDEQRQTESGRARAGEHAMYGCMEDSEVPQGGILYANRYAYGVGRGQPRPVRRGAQPGQLGRECPRRSSLACGDVQ